MDDITGIDELWVKMRQVVLDYFLKVVETSELTFPEKPDVDIRITQDVMDPTKYWFKFIAKNKSGRDLVNKMVHGWKR